MGSPRQYGTTTSTHASAAKAAAHQPDFRCGHPARRIQTGSNTAGNTLAVVASATGTTESEGHFLNIARPETIPRIAKASLWPLPANSTITKGFQAYTASRKLRRGSLRKIHANTKMVSTSASSKGILKATGPGQSFQAARKTSSDAGG